MADNQPGNVTDPFRTYNFRISLGGERNSCFFTECEGLGVKVEAIPYREGGAGHLTRYVPGRVEYAQVTLRFGVTQSALLWNWMQASIEGKVERENISIVMVNADGSDGFHWNLSRAWPTEWRAARLDALSQGIAIESLTLAYEELERKT